MLVLVFHRCSRSTPCFPDVGEIQNPGLCHVVGGYVIAFVAFTWHLNYLQKGNENTAMLEAVGSTDRMVPVPSMILLVLFLAHVTDTPALILLSSMLCQCIPFPRLFSLKIVSRSIRQALIVCQERELKDEVPTAESSGEETLEVNANRDDNTNI